MNRRRWMMLSGAALVRRAGAAGPQQPVGPNPSPVQVTPDKLLLKDYRPRSIYKVPQTEVPKAKYPIIDVHNHGVRPPQQLDEMVKTMDAVGVERTVIFTGASNPETFAEARRTYSKFLGRFDLWCSFDLAGSDQPGFGPNALKALEQCRHLGALGVGEVVDKGKGLGATVGTEPASWGRMGGPRPSAGPHPDDPRMDALWERCAQLGMPVNIHVSDPIWAYLPKDNTNDGLMNGFTWRLNDKPGLLGHDGLIESLERALNKHPKTIFIACHLANLDYDLTRLGQMFDRNPNLYADISARFSEIAPIPRFVNHLRVPNSSALGSLVVSNLHGQS